MIKIEGPDEDHAFEVTIEHGGEKMSQRQDLVATIATTVNTLANIYYEDMVEQHDTDS